MLTIGILFGIFKIMMPFIITLVIFHFGRWTQRKEIYIEREEWIKKLIEYNRNKAEIKKYV